MSPFFAWPGPSGRESFRFGSGLGRALIAAAVCALATVAGQADEPKLLKVPADKDWKIEIIPGPSIGSPVSPKISRPGVNPASYSEVYNSIPFRRSEYNKNPSYRHEATIELLVGQIPTKVSVNVGNPGATCCSPQTAMFDRWFAPWGTNAFDYRYSRYRP